MEYIHVDAHKRRMTPSSHTEARADMRSSDHAVFSNPSELHSIANQGPQVTQAKAFQQMANSSQQALQAKTYHSIANASPIQRDKEGDTVEPEHDSSAFSSEKDKQEKIKAAFDAAHVMVTKAIPKIDKEDAHYKMYIDGGTVDTDKTDARVAHVASGFEKIKTHLEEEKTTMKKWDLPAEHKFKEESTYGYVKGSETAANIYLGGVFWKAPPTGFDSRAGTIIHELTHKLHGTVDHAYGRANSKKFAEENPAKGSTNADNYEHFAEGA